ncbi:hypothetical protein ECE50_026310 [Chitinophaga sp. Mgbs1]|uniref:D-tyrosyl-tRNA(Tyr) deacylase n=1 Tax=Chitinophaga solisilvae TaxID=1233460 RepID=A0A3S1AYJ1_9BACT|nr:hypothetical protein [Chitinophaga solisilvae]
MTTKDELTRLVETGGRDDIVPFLKKLTDADKQALIPVLKELGNWYSDVIEIRPGSWSTRMSADQAYILAAASFACYDKNTFRKSLWLVSLFSGSWLCDILPWYCPAWFATLMQELSDEEGLPGGLTYPFLMEMGEQGWISVNPALVVNCLTMAIFPYHDKRMGYDTSILFRYPITMQEHFWYLLTYPTNIHFSDRWLHVSDKTGEAPNWKSFILKCSSNGTLDRLRLLEECLKTANRNFNKLLTAWWMDIFTALTPAKEELLTMQETLFLTLDSPQSKAVNTALSAIKTLMPEKEFDSSPLLHHLPQVLSSGVKSVLVTTISILEKMYKQHPQRGDEISSALAPVFVSREEAVQTRAAKLIAQCGRPEDTVLQDQLQLFQSLMLTETTKLLQQFFTSDVPATTAADITDDVARPLLSEENLIPAVQGVEELIFLASQAFENNASWHIDQLPAALINLQPELTTAALLQLEPAFQRAYAIYYLHTGGSGMSDNMLALFLLNAGKIMADNSSDYTQQLRQLSNKKHWWHKHAELTPFLEWKQALRYEPIIFDPFLQLLSLALRKITEKDTRPLLSTPTHTPGWIDPCVLIRRLHRYQSEQAVPDDMDWQIAISRCALQDTQAAIMLAKELLQGEYLRLMLFLLDASAMPQGPFTFASAWMQAGLTKAPAVRYDAFMAFPWYNLPPALLSGNCSWQTFSEKYLAYGDYNREKKSYERYVDHRAVLRIDIPVEEATPQHEVRLLQEYICDSGRQLYLHNGDVMRVMLLMPNNPALLLARIIGSCQTSSGVYEVSETGMVTAAIQCLHELDIIPGEMVLLFVSACMLHADKTIRAFAAAYWTTRVTSGKIDSRQLGSMTGMHERIGWAPLKRFCDLISGHMWQISRQHNRELEVMLQACLECFTATPVKDQKKLLEIYHEVLAVNNSRIGSTVLPGLLADWASGSTLKKAAGNLQKLLL